MRENNNNCKMRVQVLHPMENVNSFQHFCSNFAAKRGRVSMQLHNHYLNTLSLVQGMGMIKECFGKTLT
jgi:hypothetical protein